MSEYEEMAERIIALRDRRGLSAPLATRLFEVRDPSLVDQAERATDADIAKLNEGYAQAMEFERSMKRVDGTMNTEPGDVLARIKALAEEISARR